jgi:hypothetical protein
MATDYLITFNGFAIFQGNRQDSIVTRHGCVSKTKNESYPYHWPSVTAHPKDRTWQLVETDEKMMRKAVHFPHIMLQRSDDVDRSVLFSFRPV